MARLISSPLLAKLLAAARHHVVKLEVQDIADAWVDLSLWFRSFTWSEDRDSGAASGTLTLRREAMVDGVLHSLAPLVSASPLNETAGAYDPRLNPFRRVRVSVATVLSGTTPGEDEFFVVFDGVIDDPEWGGRASVVTLAVRDLAAPLQDTLIEVERIYGSEAGTPIADVLQQILDDNGFDALTVVVQGDTEGWSLKPYKQARGVSVWEACQALALQMGWDFRYAWNIDSGSNYHPRLIQPNRDTATVTLALTTAQFTDIPRLRLNGTDVRNAGELPYGDPVEGAEGVATYQDDGSIAAFGRRAFGLERQPNIDTYEEALQLITAAVLDMSTPYVEQDAALPLLWFLQLGDVLEFPGTGTPFYDEAQRFGVVRLTHTVASTGKGSTTVSLRGRPIGAYQRWLALLRQRAADAAGGPTPVIGPLLGEASADGGNSGDGRCWLFVQMEPSTESVDVYTSTGATAPLNAPPLIDVYRMATVRRLEGVTASAPDWRTLVPIDTTPDYYRRTYARGNGYDQRQGLPITHTAQAVDGFSATLGDITALTVTREGAANVLEITAAASTSPHDLFLLVWRDGLPLTLLPWAASTTWSDEGISTDRDYVYEVQAFTHDNAASALSGPRRGVRRAPEAASTAPYFVNDTPVTPSTFYTGRYGIPEAVAQATQVDAACDDPACAFIDVQRWNGGLWLTVRSVPNPTPGATHSMVFYVAPYPYLRLRSRNAAGVVLEYSEPQLSHGELVT